ncbi:MULTISPECIES: ABC transporter substrate-binding protein [unclassified Aeromicrobium]|uniref:ABC transporter substrate-binding protein n=1 Tax=unclassified Aeromicrobium TaxID=2633570 RepID=UPI00396B295D
MKRHPRRATTALLAGVVSAALLLSACAGGGSETTGSEDPIQGGTLKYRSTNVQSADPAANTGYGPVIPLRGLVDSLVFNAYDGSFEPWLATEWTVDEKATRYEFTLREGVTFSNGEVLDAAAVKTSFDALRSQGAKYAVVNSWIGDLKQITTPDDQTVVFEFSSPNSSFLQAVSSTSLGIVAPETSALSFDERQEGLSIIGSGAFTLTENRGDEGYTLTRRDDYEWAPAPAENQGPAHLETIEVFTTPDNSIAAAELRAGNLDLIHNTEPADKTEFAASDEITIRREPLPGTALGFVVNTEVPGLDDPEVRRALALGVDRDAVLERASSIDIAPTSAFTASNPFYTDQSELISSDAKKAAAQLDAAGWTKGADGIREKNGDRLSFELIYGASTVSHEPNIAVVQSQWKDLGVELKFSSLTPAELNQRQIAGDFGLTWASGTRPDTDALRTNYKGLDPQLDDLFEQILAEPDFEGRKALAAQASELILTEAYYIPLYDFIQPIAYRNTTKLPTFEASHIPWLGDVWLDKA